MCVLHSPLKKNKSQLNINSKRTSMNKQKYETIAQSSSSNNAWSKEIIPKFGSWISYIYIIHGVRKCQNKLGSRISYIYIIHGVRKCQNKLGSWISYIYKIHGVRKCQNKLGSWNLIYIYIYIIHGVRKCQNKLGSWISYRDNTWSKEMPKLTWVMDLIYTIHGLKEMSKLTWVMDLTYITHALRKFQHLGHGRFHIIQDLRKCKKLGVPNCQSNVNLLLLYVHPSICSWKAIPKKYLFWYFRVVIIWAHSSKHGECFCTSLKALFGWIYPKCDAIVRKDWKANFYDK